MNRALPSAGTTETRPLWRTALATATAGACLALYGAAPQAAVADTLQATVQAESMAKSGGCTSTDSTRAVYYCNNDSTSTSYAFPQAGRYSITVAGASSQNNTAGISVYVGSAKVAALTFTGTSYTRQSAVFDIASAGSQEIRLKLETDNGQNDTYVDYFELAYQGPTPAAPPPPSRRTRAPTPAAPTATCSRRWTRPSPTRPSPPSSPPTGTPSSPAPTTPNASTTRPAPTATARWRTSRTPATATCAPKA
ncbi:hypothetical protein ACFQ2M_14280 [Kitasatospora saccharophila]|uniref:hypothetical protein n=1 Tax=Kitasatospora saccharophila TaxID=407973 RepID=UPI0036299461